MSVHVEWMHATEVGAELVNIGTEMPDGQFVDQPAALVLNGNEVVVIEGTVAELRAIAVRILNTLPKEV